MIESKNYRLFFVLLFKKNTIFFYLLANRSDDSIQKINDGLLIFSCRMIEIMMM